MVMVGDGFYIPLPLSSFETPTTPSLTAYMSQRTRFVPSGQPAKDQSADARKPTSPATTRVDATQSQSNDKDKPSTTSTVSSEGIHLSEGDGERASLSSSKSQTRPLNLTGLKKKSNSVTQNPTRPPEATTPVKTNALNVTNTLMTPGPPPYSSPDPSKSTSEKLRNLAHAFNDKQNTRHAPVLRQQRPPIQASVHDLTADYESPTGFDDASTPTMPSANNLYFQAPRGSSENHGYPQINPQISQRLRSHDIDAHIRVPTHSTVDKSSLNLGDKRRPIDREASVGHRKAKRQRVHEDIAIPALLHLYLTHCTGLRRQLRFSSRYP